MGNDTQPSSCCGCDVGFWVAPGSVCFSNCRVSVGKEDCLSTEDAVEGQGTRGVAWGCREKDQELVRSLHGGLG